MKTNFLKRIVLIAIVAVAFSSCTKDELVNVQQEPTADNLKTASAWSRVFTDDFTNTGSWNNWTRTERLDYNSKLCQYLASVPLIATYDSRSCLVLTATKNGSIWNSGHVKSNYSFKPELNTEYRTSAYIKLIAVNGGNYANFSSTYGLWPAFWTVQETSWPVKGEIDIFEGYSYGTFTKFASNLFYSNHPRRSLLGTSCERPYPVSEGWHLYDQFWANVNGAVTVTIQLDGVTVAAYTNADNRALKLENFGPHNIMLNLNVGATTWNAFDNNLINVFDKTMMWVDYVTVDKRTL